MSQFTATWPPFDGAIENSTGAQVTSGTKHRARLGVIVPSVNTVVEPWYSAVVPPGVSVHATRMLLADHITADALRQMDREEGVASAVRIASCRPDAIAYSCTASSIVQGIEYDAHLQ